MYPVIGLVQTIDAESQLQGGLETEGLFKRSADDFDYHWQSIVGRAIQVLDQGGDVWDDFNADPSGPFNIRGDSTYLLVHRNALYSLEVNTVGLWGRSPGTPIGPVHVTFIINGGATP